MREKEMLELAGNAAGFDLSHFDKSMGKMVVHAFDGDTNSGIYYWNPLEDDGEALRLAVKLLLEIDMTPTTVVIRSATGIKVRVGVTMANDLYATMRLAIVTMASAIGKAMQ